MDESTDSGRELAPEVGVPRDDVNFSGNSVGYSIE